MSHRTRNLQLLAVGVIALLLLDGCAVGYYWQAAQGQLALMRERRPIEDVIADPATDPKLRAKLETVSAALEFAHDALKLPDNGSYRTYADLSRPYALWNVVASPPLSLVPRTWCFPIAGCVSYRGYFGEANAHKFAKKQARDGDDVYVGGVAAYSTLGRLEDPVMNTMMHLPANRLAALIFHELAHQLAYAPGDSQFNEGFASFIEIEGARRWHEAQADPEATCALFESRRRRAQVKTLVEQVRRALKAVYESQAPDEYKLLSKSVLMRVLPAAYQKLQRDWDGPPRYDGWFAKPFSNARLAALATYDTDIPAFAALLAEHSGNLTRFYTDVQALADAPQAQRRARLKKLRQARAADPVEINCSRSDIQALANLQQQIAIAAAQSEN